MDKKIIFKSSDTWNAIFRDRDTSGIRDPRDIVVRHITVSGETDRLTDGKTPRIAIVGTRDLDAEGREYCARIVNALAENKSRPIIVSGLALGTEACVHRAALNVGLPTVAVLPTNVDDIYPHAHITLAEEISATRGCCLLSRFETGTPPEVINFPLRNKTIAALADLVIVVEAKRTGGSLNIARYAQAFFNVPVLAIPGSLSNPRFAGCNELISQGTAEMLCNFDSLKSYRF